MATKTLKTTPKISVKIWRAIMDKLDKKMEAACLRRDAYLSKVINTELDWLDAEVSIPNSQAGYDYVFSQLDLLDRKLVSLALPSELTTRINEICKRKRIVRDAFFNRLFLLLAVDPISIDRLLFSNVYEGDWRTDVWREEKHNFSSFENVFSPMEQDIDPFWPIRTGLTMYADNAELEDYVEPTTGKVIKVKRNWATDTVEPADSLYTITFNQKVGKGNESLLGLNCYMPDCQIPGTGAEKVQREKLDEMFKQLEAL